MYKEKLINIAKEILMAAAEHEISTESKEFKVALMIIKELQEKPDQIQSNIGARTDMLFHILAVVELIKKEGKSFSEACKIRAGIKDINDSSVRQACCRSLDYSAYYWNQFATGSLDRERDIKNKLINKYPSYKDKIIAVFKGG
jgi:hypothetical protein